MGSSCVVLLLRYNEAYTWTNPTCCVHNIIVGQLWIEQYGNVEVVNHRWGHNTYIRNYASLKICLFLSRLGPIQLTIILRKSDERGGKWTEQMRKFWVTQPAESGKIMFCFSHFSPRTGEKCCLNFKPCGLFGKELHKVEGYILDKRYGVHWCIMFTKSLG